MAIQNLEHADGDGLLLQYKSRCKKYRGRAVVTLPVLLFNEYHRFKCFKKSETKSKKPSSYKKKEATTLRELMKLAVDRDVSAGLTKELCGCGVMEKL